MREMDDNHISKLENIDTQRLYINANLRVVSTIYPRDMSVTQLYNKPNIDELMANLAPSVMGLIPFAPLILENFATRSSPSATTSSGASSKQRPPSRGSPSNMLPAPTRSDLPRPSTTRPSRQRHLQHDAHE